MCQKKHIDRTCHCRTLAKCFKQNNHLSQAARTGTSQDLSRAAKKGSSCCCPSGVAGSKSLASNIVNRTHWIFVKPFTMSMLKGLTSIFCPLTGICQDIWSKCWVNKHESTYWQVTAWSSIQSWGHLDLVTKWVLIWNLSTLNTLIWSCSKIGSDTSTGSRAKSTPANTICSQTVSQSSRTGSPSVGRLCLNCQLATFHLVLLIENLFGAPKRLALLGKLEWLPIFKSIQC